jgi:hypothetical protein
MPGPLIVYASAIVVAVAVAGAWLALTRRPSATGIRDLVAIDGEYAAMVRDVDGDPGRAFLSLISAERGEVWGAMIPHYQAGEETLLGATAGKITVRASTGDVPYIHVFAAKRGAKLGRYALADTPGHVLGADASTIADSGQSFELLRGSGPARGSFETAVAAFDLEQGRPLWRRALGAPVAPLWLSDRHLVLRAGNRVHVLDRHTGEPARIHTAGHSDGVEDGVALSGACAVAGRVYGVSAGGVVAALSPDGGELRATALAATRLAPDDNRVCGTHGDRDIVTTTAADGATTLVALDARSGAVAWRLELPGVPPDASSGLHAHVSADLRVEPWPRFLPVLVGATEPQLMWIDLEAGNVARAGTPTRVLSSARIARAGGRFYLWTPEGPTLAILGGDRPAITAAVEIPDMWPVLPQHVAGGRVWVTQGTDRREHPRAWLVLDGESLAVVAAGTGEELTTRTARDARAGLGASLGLP